MTIQLQHEKMLQLFQERIISNYSSRKKKQLMISVFKNISHRMPELIEIAQKKSKKELREAVKLTILNAGYTYATVRETAGAISRFLEVVS